MSTLMGSLSPTPLLGALYTSKWARTIFLLGALVAVSRVDKLVRGIRAVGSLPGLCIPFGPCSVLGGSLPLAWWNPNHVFVWKWRKKRNLYLRLGCDTVSFVPFLYGTPAIFTRSLEVGKQILDGGLDAFDKSSDFEGPFSFWGPNIIDAYGGQWRKHRKIAGPAFNNNTYATVWDASRRVFAEMMTAQGWSSKDVIEVSSVHSITFKFSLTVFISAGFGVPLAWSKSSSEEGELGVEECFEMIVKTSMLPLILPTWAWKLPFERIQRMCRAYDTMRAFMQSHVTMIRETIRSEAADGDSEHRNDLFSLLVRASEDVVGKKGLSDQELIGDVFSFLFAGHDTAAHALAATIACLALNFDIQDEIASQVREVIEGKDANTLLHEDYPKLDKVLAAFYEAIRMFPPAPYSARAARRDVVLNISDTNGPNLLAVKKGTHVMVDLVGIHYHPKYYSEPEVYQPSRWFTKKRDQGSDVRDDAREFTGFGIGTRSCIGRKYATTEAVCFLAHLLRDWRVEPLLAQSANGQVETVNEWRERVLQADILITLGVKDYGIRFVRRK